MMTRKIKTLAKEEVPEFKQSIEEMSEDSKIFVDKSVEIAYYIHYLMEQKGMNQKDLADKLGKTEPEVSKWLGGLHNYTLRSLAKLESAIGAQIIHVPKPQYSVAALQPMCKSVETIRETREEKPVNKTVLNYRLVSELMQNLKKQQKVSDEKLLKEVEKNQDPQNVQLTMAA